MSNREKTRPAKPVADDDSFDSFLRAVARVPDRDQPEDPQFVPGLKVTSNIELLRKLGEGGMGSVWVAKHETLATEVAVKFVAPGMMASDPNAAKRFKREARAAAQVKSPHSVRVFDHGTMDDGTPFIVMELLEGESLHDRLARSPLDLDEADRLLSQVAEVLDRAHGAGLLHRDIKPGNLFLVEMGYGLFVKLLDFGLAKQVKIPEDSHITCSGTTLGTAAYMSPGQIRSAGDIGPEADLWALAVTMYEALTCRLPFSGETAGGTMVEIATADFMPVSELRDDIPNVLDDWFSRALQKDSGQRFASAKAMSEAFRVVITDMVSPPAGATLARPASARPISSPSRAQTVARSATEETSPGETETDSQLRGSSSHASTSVEPSGGATSVSPARILVGVIALGTIGLAFARLGTDPIAPTSDGPRPAQSAALSAPTTFPAVASPKHEGTSPALSDSAAPSATPNDGVVSNPIATPSKVLLKPARKHVAPNKSSTAVAAPKASSSSGRAPKRKSPPTAVDSKHVVEDELQPGY